MYARIIICLLLMGVYNLSRAQQGYTLSIISEDNPSLLKTFSYKNTHPFVKDGYDELNKVLFACYDKAYLTANYDSIIQDSLSIRAVLKTGKPYQWASLSPGNVDEGVLSEIGFREKLYLNKPFHYKEVGKIQEKIITYYENNGYPFVSVKLDSIVFSDTTIAAQLNITKNKEIKIDSVIIHGTAKISPVYIHNYLGIKPGSRYDESRIKKINTRLAELPFIQNTSPASVLFTDTHNKVILNLNHRQASRFDGIVGIMTDPQTEKTFFTGDIQLMLQNGFNKGELIDLNWRRLQTQTQDVKLHFVYPFLFNTPFGIDYMLKLYKRDTTFLDVNHNIGVQYLLTGGNYFKLFYNNKTSALLSTTGMEFITQLPPYADISSNMYGVGVKYEKLDYRLNPRKGFYIFGSSSAGIKTIRKNAKMNPAIYEGLKLTTTQYTGDIDVGMFFPLGKISTIKTGVKSAFLSGQNIFENELFRIGGLKTLRGFNEEEIFASAYSIFTLEYRLLLEKNSYMYIFGDGAYYEKVTTTSRLLDRPFGFGAGISFETKAGIFSMSYALGKQFNNPILFRNGKIHFGIVNYF